MKQLWLGLLLSLKVFAGDSVGSGGDLIVCPETREVLDYFEARQNDPAYRLGFQGMASSAEEKVRWALGRLALRDPARASAYLQRLERFQMETLFVPGPLENVLDTGEVKIPEECEVRQLAIQRPPAFPSDYRYLIDRSLWADLFSSSEQQAGLMLHEIIYRETLQLGHENSAYAREFNRVISGERFLELSQADYDLLVGKVFAAVVKVAFKQNVFSLSSGMQVSLPLRPLLAQAGPGQVSWYADSNCPPWLHVDAQKEVLYGTAPASGSHTFQLIVKQGTAAAIAEIDLKIVLGP